MFTLRPTTLALSLLAAVAGATSLRGQTSSSSPFMPSAGSVGQNVAASAGTHELVGVIASSKQTLVGITDKTTRKSIWIPVGSSAEGIDVISCDAKQDTAVVRIRGEVMTLSMHGSTILGATQPNPFPSVVPSYAATQGRTPAQLEQEKEARLLVSDLLEIGIQQRKAYEAAQREAAGKKSGPLPSAPAPK